MRGVFALFILVLLWLFMMSGMLSMIVGIPSGVIMIATGVAWTTMLLWAVRTVWKTVKEEWGYIQERKSRKGKLK